VWIVDDYGIDPASLKGWVWVVTVFAGLTMVNNVSTGASNRSISEERAVSGVFVVVLIIALVSYQPAIVLFAGFVGYGLSGYAGLVWGRWKRRRATSVLELTTQLPASSGDLQQGCGACRTNPTSTLALVLRRISTLTDTFAAMMGE
jgi:CDP-diacylglycerol--serine O-phosphatidyltransferase